ncbi:hypothetical protein T260_05065 [Geobacillus thermopakistaniensis]|nr:hypothetical protein T260_05065 [Geobacillus sp. MAS1]
MTTAKIHRRVMEPINNVFRQHSQGNSDKFFRKGKRFDKFGQPHISARFIKWREERKTMQLTNLTFPTPKGNRFSRSYVCHR